MLVWRPVLFPLAVLLALAGCSAGASASISPSGSTSSSASQSPRTLTFQLNALTGYTAHGIAEVDITGGGYTLTVTVEGLDPNSRHTINIHDSSCSALAFTFEQWRTEVTADANGKVVSVTQFPTAYAIPADGRILTVHGNHGTTQDLSHIACADLTN